MNFKELFKITKMEITFLVDMVAVAAFFSNPSFSGRLMVLVPLLAAGTLSSISAAVFNNIYDMDIDLSMRRTSYRNRVINAGNVRSIFLYSTVALAASLAISYIFINLLATVMIFSGFLSYVLLYTVLLKRRTTWNIVIGGIAGSFPALAGWSAVSNSISLTSVFIAFLVFLWTPTHFWSLATNNAEDYRRAGVPMLPAVLDAKKTGFWITMNSVILVIYSLLPVFVPQIHVGIAYFIIAGILGAVLLFYVVMPVIHNFSPKDYRKAFHFSNYYLLILLVAICLVNFVR